MTKLKQNVITLLRPGGRYDSRFFVNSILADQSAKRFRVVKEDDGTPFIYPVSFSPLAGKDRDDRTFEYFGDAPPSVLEALRNGRGLFVIDHSNEGMEPKNHTLKLLHDRFSALGIPTERVLLLTQNMRFEDGYNEWIHRQGDSAPKQFQVAIYHCFLRQLATYAEKDLGPAGELSRRVVDYNASIDSGASRPKRYLCLNFTPRGHRLATMLHIMQHGLESMGHISFPGLANRKMSVAGRTEHLLKRQPFPDIELLQQLLPTLEAQPALQLDTDPFVRVSPVIDVGEWWYYAESWFSLVTESGVNGRGHERFTEKPFKAILGLHPFLIIGLPRTLKLMREYGFQTFAPFIDETYDSIEDDKLRIALVLAEFRRLCALTDDDWALLTKKIQHIVLHNFNQFMGPLQKYFLETVEDPLLDRMALLAAPRNT